MSLDLSAIQGFAGNRLDRRGNDREDPALQARWRAAPDALHALFAGDQPLLKVQGDGLAGLLPAASAGGGGRESVFLGLMPDGRPVFATARDELPQGTAETEDGLVVGDLRALAAEGRLGEDVLGALAQAKSLLSWHRNHRFCARCGAETAQSPAGWRRDCAACGAQHFPRTDPVVIMLVRRGDACFLARQARFAPGVYSCLAGFVEPGETLEDAVRREVMEEAGLASGAVAYLCSQPWPFPSSLMIGCVADAAGGEVTLDLGELEDGRWFTRDEVALMLRGGHPAGLRAPPPLAIAHHLLRAFAEGRA